MWLHSGSWIVLYLVFTHLGFPNCEEARNTRIFLIQRASHGEIPCHDFMDMCNCCKCCTSRFVHVIHHVSTALSISNSSSKRCNRTHSSAHSLGSSSNSYLLCIMAGLMSWISHSNAAQVVQICFTTSITQAPLLLFAQMGRWSLCLVANWPRVGFAMEKEGEARRTCSVEV